MAQQNLVGKEIKGYRLTEEIGKGGFGSVYKAQQPLVKREVAIKVILPGFTNNPEFIRRFEAEAQLVANLEHPYIVPLYDFWRDANGAFLVMRWLRGGSLRDVLKRGHWPLSDIPRVLDQITSALAIAHRNGVVHRDIKPENILLDEDKNAYLADFGIARDTQRIADHGTFIEEAEKERLVGSPDFMSPEQIQLATITPQTDIYSLGIVLYMMITGKKPYEGSDLSTVISKHLFEPVPNIQDIRPDLPDEINQVIERATEKNPADRYDSILDMAAEFRQALEITDTLALEKLNNATLPGINLGEIINRQTLVGDDLPTQTFSFVVENPYKGLRAFQEADADDFYGRTTLVEKLLAELATDTQRSRFLAVVGPSGSGKSSLVRAGIIPAIRRGDLEHADKWFITDMIPGTHPLEELEAALLRVAVNPPASLMEQLERDERGLVRAVKRILPGGDDAETEVVLFIDQFEEIFTQIEDETTRAHFLNNLLSAAQDANSRLRVIVTLRADFYDRPLMYPEFGELMRECTEVVLPLSRDELQEAIVRPAERNNLHIEDDLLVAMLSDVSQQPGMLPMMQYALTELYERRELNQLTKNAYDDIGGVSGALARRAEEIYEALSEKDRTIVRQIFLRLVTLGDGVEDTRRRTLLSELLSLQDGDRVQAIIDHFGKYRLLTFDHDPATRTPTVEIAHEALIRQWHRLRDWLDESRDDLRTQRRLATNTREWTEANREPSYLITGTRLTQFEEWQQTTNINLTDVEREYLQASLTRRNEEAQAEAERAAREAELEQRSRTVLRALVVVMSVAAVIAIGLSVFAFDQRNAAVSNAEAAATAQDEAVIQAQNAATAAAIAEANEEEARSLAFISGAQAALADDNTDLALLLGMEAVEIDNSTPQIQRTLAEVAYTPGTRRIFEGHTDRVETVAYSPDGTQMLSAGNDNLLILWDVKTGELVQEYIGHEDWIWDAVFSPDGSQALSASRDGTAILWNLETGDMLQRFEGHTDEVQAVAFSTDSTTVITGSHDRTLIIWDVSNGEQVLQLGADGAGHTDRIHDIAYSQSGFTALSSSADGSVILWNLNTGQPLLRYQGENGGIWKVTYTPNELGMMTGAFDGAMLLWSFETGQPIREFIGHTDRVTGIDFSADGRQIVSSSQDGSLLLWDFETANPLRRYVGHTDRVYDVAYSPTADQFISAGWDQVLRLWDVNNGAQRHVFQGHETPVLSLTVDADETTIASGGTDGTIILWNFETREELFRLTEHTGSVNTLAFTPDGQQLLSGGDDNRILLWNVDTGELIQQFGAERGGHSDAVFTLTIHPDGTQAISGSRDSTVIFWDMETGERIERMFEHTFHVVDAAYSPDGTRVATAGRDNQVILWDAETSEVVRRFTVHNDWVFTVAFSPNGEHVLSGGAENNLILWEAASGQPLMQLEGHDTFIYDAVFSPDGTHAISSSADGDMILWDIETGTEKQHFEGHTDEARQLQYLNDKQFLSASGDATIRLWEVQRSVEEIADWIESNRYLRDFSCAERDSFNVAPLCPPATPVFDPGSV